jgi:type II secretory pathway pseudopilin PulG
VADDLLLFIEAVVAMSVFGVSATVFVANFSKWIERNKK